MLTPRARNPRHCAKQVSLRGLFFQCSYISSIASWSNRCSITGVTKTVICILLSMGWCNNISLAASRKSNRHGENKQFALLLHLLKHTFHLSTGLSAFDSRLVYVTLLEVSEREKGGSHSGLIDNHLATEADTI